jgi:hypothetical protein
MARSAHAFVRGSTAKFYEWLEESKGKLPAGPSIWICGDCHVGNLGPLADSDANVNIQIRDLTSLIWRKTNSSRSISRKISALRRAGSERPSPVSSSDNPGGSMVALARKLLIALSRYVTHGEIPAGPRRAAGLRHDSAAKPERRGPPSDLARATLLRERIRHTNRIRGLLFGQGITNYNPLPSQPWRSVLSRPGCSYFR